MTAECISALYSEIRKAEATVEWLRAQSLKESSSGDEALLRVLRAREPLVEEEAQLVDEAAWTPLADDPAEDRYDPHLTPQDYELLNGDGRAVRPDQGPQSWQAEPAWTASHTDHQPR